MLFNYWLYVRFISNSNGKGLFRFFYWFINWCIFKCLREFGVFGSCWANPFNVYCLTIDYSPFQCIGIFSFWVQLVLMISRLFVSSEGHHSLSWYNSLSKESNFSLEYLNSNVTDASVMLKSLRKSFDSSFFEHIKMTLSVSWT